MVVLIAKWQNMIITTISLQKRPCSPCIDNANNPNCCMERRPDLWPKVDTVMRILRENFLLNQPKKSGWLIEENQENIPKNL